MNERKSPGSPNRCIANKKTPGMDQIHRLEKLLPQLVQEQRNGSRQRSLPGLFAALYESDQRPAVRGL